MQVAILNVLTLYIEKAPLAELYKLKQNTGNGHDDDNLINNLIILGPNHTIQVSNGVPIND